MLGCRHRVATNHNICAGSAIACCQMFRRRASRYSAADLSADVTWKLKVKISRQPTSVPSVSSKRNKHLSCRKIGGKKMLQTAGFSATLMQVYLVTKLNVGKRERWLAPQRSFHQREENRGKETRSPLSFSTAFLAQASQAERVSPLRSEGTMPQNLIRKDWKESGCQRC